MNMRLKKWILPNLPYVGIALFATKLGQAIRIAPGADFSGKVLHMMDGRFPRLRPVSIRSISALEFWARLQFG